MELQYTPRRIRQPRGGFEKGPFLLVSIFILLLLATGIVTYAVWDKYAPNRQHVPPDFQGLEHPIFYQGKLMRESAIGSQESLKLPLKVIQEVLDGNMIYDEKSASVIITTEQSVLQLKTDKLTALLNDKPFSLSFPVEQKDGTVYVPIQPLKDYYHIHVAEEKDTGAVILQKQGDIISWGELSSPGKAKSSEFIRQAADVKAPIVAESPEGTKVMIWKDLGGWMFVQLENGITGYAQKMNVLFNHAQGVQVSLQKEKSIPWHPLGGKINMTWEQVFQKNPDTAKIGDMPGLNVISPTWFQLDQDQSGQLYIKNNADPSYVKWAHDREYQVWALFSNGFNPDWTSQALSTYDSRMNLVRQLAGFAQMYDLQGINIDFENVYVKDKDKLTQFIRELTPFLHEQGLVVSMDVTVRGGSANWSLFYDRQALGKLVDYMIVMTYDEHWASSPVAGSVASLSWTEKGIKDIIEQDHVSPQKIIIGVPFYTRQWMEDTQNGQTKVTSKAVFMSYVERTIKDKKLEPVFDEKSGQHYVEFKQDGKTVKIWIENATSMQARTALVKTYGLAGVASWRRGYETRDIWNAIQDTLQKLP